MTKHALKNVMYRITPNDADRTREPWLADEYAVTRCGDGLSLILPYERHGLIWKALTIPRAEGFHFLIARLLWDRAKLQAECDREKGQLQ